MEPEVSTSGSFRPDTVLQSLVDLTSGATLLKAGRSVRNRVISCTKSLQYFLLKIG